MYFLNCQPLSCYGPILTSYFQSASQLALFGSLIVLAWWLWQLACLATNSSLPIAVIASGSMRPAFRKGDLVIISKPLHSYDIGDIVIYHTEALAIPVIHRVVALRYTDGKTEYRTKGDNNSHDDRELYDGKTKWLAESSIEGRVIVFVPYLGQFSILVSEIPLLRPFLLLLIAMLFLVSKNGI